MIRSIRLAAVSMASLAFVSSGAVLSGTQADSTDVLSLTADGVLGTVVQGVGQLTVTGDTAVDVDVENVDGGRMQLVAGPGLLETAVRFPSYSDSSAYPRAVLSLTPTSGQALSPQSADFAYAAVYRLDATSSGSAEDNGDNLFQRGIWSEPSMFKLELDSGHPTCVVKGSEGRVTVRSPTKVQPNEWYRTVCSRVGDRLKVAVTPYGTTDTVRAENAGPTGQVAFPASRPASVGGKLSGSGDVLRTASDQFNGAIARVWIDRS